MAASFSCPGCRRGGFHSLMEVKEHFGRQSHSAQCPVCQKVFRDDMAVIQHYQKYNKAQPAPANISRNTQEGPGPSRSSGGTAVTSLLRTENGLVHFEEHAPTTVNIMHSREKPSLANSVSPAPSKPLDQADSNDQKTHLKLLGDSWREIDFDTKTYPIVLHPLEQRLVLRYLRSRCHPQSRLQTEGYILGPGTVRNKQPPSKGSIPTYQFRETPPPEQQEVVKRQAIAIDCEMVGVKGNRQTLAFISAIDFLTGDVLISRYVLPSEGVIDWRSKVTGITKVIMESAMISGAAFKNWREARDKLWEFADSSTVFVGQSLNYDLEVLGICHNKIVDSAILTAEAVFPSCSSAKRLPRAWSLKAVAKVLLGLEIQIDDRAHSALEDAYAVRDVIIFCIRNPEELKSWADLRRNDEEARKRNAGQRKKGKKASKSAQSTGISHRRVRMYDHEYDYDVDDYEDFRMSDYARDAGWPDGWDPWSD